MYKYIYIYDCGKSPFWKGKKTHYFYAQHLHLLLQISWTDLARVPGDRAVPQLELAFVERPIHRTASKGEESASFPARKHARNEKRVGSSSQF